jgi:hypothetical protein
MSRATLPAAPLLTTPAWAALACTLALGPGALADSSTSLSFREDDRSPAPAVDAPRGFTVQIEPKMWFVAPSGDLTLPAGAAFADAGDSVRLKTLDLDSPRISPAGDLSILVEKWRFSLSGASYSADRDRVVVGRSFRLGNVQAAPGSALAAQMDFTTAEFTFGREFWSPDFSESSVPVRWRFSWLAGARMYDTSFEVRDLGSSARSSADEFFLEPIVGARSDLDLAEDFSIVLQVSGGGFAWSERSSFSFDIAAGFQWRPVDWLGLQIGYRQLAFTLSAEEDREEFEYDGRLAGLFAGVTLRF